MSRKNNLITTSAIISLLLFNVNTAHAEDELKEPQEVQEPQTTEVQLQEKANDPEPSDGGTIDEVISILSNVLDEDELAALNQLIDNNSDILQDTFMNHELSQFTLASERYNEILDQQELSEKEFYIVSLFNELAINELTLSEYAESSEEEIPAETDTEIEVVEENVSEPEENESTDNVTSSNEETKTPEVEEDNTQQEEPKARAATAFSTYNVKINSESNVNYRGYLASSNGTINRTPGGALIQNIGNLKGREVRVSKEASTTDGTWVQVNVMGTNVNGWVRKDNITEEQISSVTNVEYRGYLKRSSDTINTRPWGTRGYREVRRVNDLQGSEVEVIQEAKTQRATWLYVRVRGTNVTGWIDKAGVDTERILSQKNTSYRGVLSRTTDTLNTKPWGTAGFEEIRRVNDLKGTEVEVLREATTQRATWLYVNVRGTNITGWIDKAGVTPESVISEKDVNYRGYLARPNDTINTLPWGTPGYKEVRRVNDLEGKEVRVLKEAVTQRATWLYVEVNGTNIKGWIDKSGITPEAISKQVTTNYRGYLSRQNDTINTLPWGMPGYQEVRRVNGLRGKEVKVLREATTQRAAWLYVEVVGTDIKGWIDKAGVNPEAISNRISTNYRGYLNRSNDTINTLPWGVPGYKEVRRVNNLKNNEVKVLEEVTTQRATWLYVEVVGTDVKGWIDKAGVRPESISSEKNVNYRAFLLRESDSINTLPWGVPGYKEVRRVNDLKNKEVHVTREAVTDRATWVYVTVVGEDISGWVDKKGIIQTSVAYRNTYYNLTFAEALDAQMNAGYPQTDLYGGGWKDAKEEDVARYLNPENFVDVNNGTIPNMEYVQITASALNVRNAPTTSGSKIIATVTRNQTYEILDVSNNWYKIDVNGVAGWVSGNYVALISEIQFRPKDKIGTVTASALNVRSNPSTSGSIVTQIKNGQTYKIIDEDNGWYKLDINGTQGWASGSYLDVSIDINRDNLQFLSLSSPSGLSVSDLNEILDGKGILEGKGAAFLEASQKYAVNEIYLISHALLETGNGGSQLATGVKVNGTTVYNMYGIGAYDHNALAGGSQRAYKEGWDTPEKAIIGGAEFINSSYVNSSVHKQDTLYKMKWNPANPPTRYQRADGVWVNVAHQYATDIGWAVKQTRTLDLITEYSAKYNLVLKFDIPIYN